MSSSADLVGKGVALLLMGQDAAGEDDWAVFNTVLQEDDGQLVLQHWTGRLVLSEAWALRIKATSPEMRSTMLDLDFFLPLTVGNLSEHEATALETTGFRWPKTPSES
jgi:hypothetical protein